MDSIPVEDRSRNLQEAQVRNSNEMNGITEKSSGDVSSKKKSRKSKNMPKFGCFGVENNEDGNFDMKVDRIGEPPSPTHLVIMINGIIGSAADWKFGAKQLSKKYPRDVVVHRSKVNSTMSTFDGVDVMGGRLAEEVITVIKRHPSVQKISLVGHSLGGLIARYAIAKLYGRGTRKENGDCKNDEFEDASVGEKLKGKIAGLEPVNFITFATPHLGSRCHKQGLSGISHRTTKGIQEFIIVCKPPPLELAFGVPGFCGFYTMENVAARMSGLLGRTGRHLFLADCDNGKSPLLVQMVNDSEDLKFISALESFKRRIAYANARFDHLVGWSTSSLRHRTELPKRRHLSKDNKYPHVVYIDSSKIAKDSQGVPSTARINGCKTANMEEEMLRGLTKVSWERVDVYFRGGAQRFWAHTTIQVKGTCLNSDGADVIQHMVDNFLL